jgi:hypothetical protein
LPVARRLPPVARSHDTICIAANRPDAPMMPPPGWVPAPHCQ